MGELKDIKDRSFNENLVARIKSLLDMAEKGELRSIIYALEYPSSTITHGWAIDARTNDRAMLAEVLIMQTDLANNIGLLENDSVLSRALYEE